MKAAAGRQILYRRNYHRMERAKTLLHLAPALVLLGSVQSIFSQHEPFGLLQLVEIGVGATYLVLMTRELLHLRHGQPPHHVRVAWLELAAAGILALEGYHIWHRHHEHALTTGEHRFHVLPWLYAALALWYVAMAFGLGRLYERRHLHLHTGGLAGRLGLFQAPFDFRWDAIEAVTAAGPDAVQVAQVGGPRRTLSFADVHEGPAVRDQVLAHAAAYGRGAPLDGTAPGALSKA